MSLSKDLEPALSDFLTEDREERERRQEFLAKWDTTQSAIAVSMQEIVRLLSNQPAFSAEVKRDEHISIVLSVTFKDASGVSTTDNIVFAPDSDYLFIACQSSFDGPPDEVRKLDLSQLDTSLIEHQIKKFFKRFLTNRRYTGMILRKLSDQQIPHP